MICLETASWQTYLTLVQKAAAVCRNRAFLRVTLPNILQTMGQKLLQEGGPAHYYCTVDECIIKRCYFLYLQDAAFSGRQPACGRFGRPACFWTHYLSNFLQELLVSQPWRSLMCRSSGGGTTAFPSPTHVFGALWEGLLLGFWLLSHTGHGSGARASRNPLGAASEQWRCPPGVICVSCASPSFTV